MREAFRKVAVASVVLLTAISGTAPALAAYSKAYTGQDCYNEYYFDGQGTQLLGSRCAKAYNEYISYNSVLWRTDDYWIRYDVTGPLSYGPHNNENPWKMSKGFSSGTQTWLSPDAGNANVGYFKRDQGTTYSLKGQSKVQIDAYADIPSAGDPRLDLDTATW